MIRASGCRHRQHGWRSPVGFAGASMTLLAFITIIAVPVAKADDPDDVLNALMMGGTGMPVPSSEWMDSIITDYLDPATGASYTALVVPTPEAAPIDSSVQTGLTDLQQAMAQQQVADPGQPYLIEGYSQSALIAVDEERELAAMADAGQPTPDVTAALFGSGNRPNGGIYERLDGLYVPGLGVDANGAEPTDLGVPTIDVADQYDGLADVPQYPANLLADVNDLLGIIYVHTSYGDGAVPGLLPDSTPLTGPFTDDYVLGSMEIVKQVTGDATYYLIPTQTLPLLDPLLNLGVPQSVLNIVQPVLQVIVEAGYDRSIPFGDPTPFELIPTLDPVTFALEFGNGVVEGADNAFELFGPQLPGAAELESALASAETWSEQAIGVPYDQVVSELNNAFDPFTDLIELERPVGEAIEDVLMATGVQQDLLDPILGLIGSLGESFTG